MQTPNDITAVLERLLPVGSIVEWSPVDSGKADLSTPEKVAAYYGFGTWEAYGSGRMTLGVNSSHAVGSTGGSETHELQLRELPEMITLPYGSSSYSGDDTVLDTDAIWSRRHINGALSIRSGGGGTPIPVMPPYIAVYRWRRIK